MSEETAPKVGLFDLLSAITETKDYIFSDDVAREYVPFIINRGLSQHVDCILYANEMNKNPQISKKRHFDFLFHSIPKKVRRGKWAKFEDSNKDVIDLIVRKYSVSRERAMEYVKLLDQSDLKALQESYSIGGKK